MKTKLMISLIAILLIVNQIQAQRIVTGKVTDDTGQEMPGVTVIAQGTSQATITDLTGLYTLSVPDGVTILIFAYIGYQNIEKPVADVVNVQMKSDCDLEEVVITATGISKVSRPISYCVQTVSGMKVRRNRKKNSNKSNPGSANNIVIRGNVSPENEFNTEEYDYISENGYKDTKENPLSTLSIDVDNASYSNVRRFLNNGQLPPKDAVRIEEMINYFTYDYPEPQNKHPFSFITEYSDCPWNKDNKLLHVGLQGKRLDYNDLKPSNFVFLIDVSGSMGSSNKLPLLKKSLLKLIDNLGRKDYVSIVVYAGAAGLVLPPTPAYNKDVIRNALNKLNAGGSTAGGAGIKLAYKTAKDAFIKDGNNRVILATDGDFNVGTSSTGALVNLIEEKRKGDIYLTILGYGMGNYKDGRMEQISNAGNGNYFYIDNIKESDKVFGKEMRANMFTIAKDVKIQIEFNPANVKAYRLIGYENRILNKEDFDDDTKDAGELGPGHTVTAIYEIVPSDSDTEVKNADELKYQQAVKVNSEYNDELMTLKFRYKPPKEDKSILIEHIVNNNAIAISKTSDNFRFSAAVAGFGMLLRDSEFKGKMDFNMIDKLASDSKGEDKNSYRKELISLIKKAEDIKDNLADK